jgi:TolB-like protein
MPPSFAARLRGSHLWKWAAAYLAFAWLFLQALDLIGDNFGWPRIIFRLAFLLICIGFVGVLVIAWHHGARGRQRMPASELITLAVLLLIALSTSLIVWRRERNATGNADPTPAIAANATDPAYKASVAVLPFEDLDSSADEYFSNGITDEIILQLGKVEGLKVISRTSVVALKGSKLTLPQIADTLGVRHVVEGTVRRAGDRVRVVAQLIDPRSDTRLWSDAFDGDLKDIFGVQEEIARRVSGALMQTVRGLTPYSAASRTERTGAYDAYLRGTQLVERRSRSGLLGAVEAFEAAIRLDSAYAPAYAGLAETYAQWAVYGYRGPIDPYVALARARILSTRAIELDPQLADGYGVRAYAGHFSWTDTDSIMADFARAIDIRPNAGKYRLWYGQAHGSFGKHEQALPEAELGTSLDPLAPGLRIGYSATGLTVGQYELALREARRAKALEPALEKMAEKMAINALIKLGRGNECVQTARRWPLLEATCLAALNQTVPRAAVLVDSTKRSLASATAAYIDLEDLSYYYALRRDIPALRSWLTQLAELTPLAGFQLRLSYPIYDGVRSEPQFQAVVAELRAYVRGRIADEVRRERRRRVRA